jgi:hypothetical protein
MECEMRTRPESQSAYAVSTTRHTCRVQPHIAHRAQGTAQGRGPSTGTRLVSFVVFGGYILICMGRNLTASM